ncbi:MAG: hypothetical protein Q4D55_07975 [Eubacteriales bacterium]|nr:hypothetical protein [Eubacteriales bacterium]
MSDNKEVSGNIRRDRKGAAMILVLCLMMLFFVLSITTILSSSVLVGRAKEDRIGKQCMVLATSFAKQLDRAMSEPLDGTKDRLDGEKFQDFVRASIDYDVDLETEVEPPISSEKKKWEYYWKIQNAYEISSKDPSNVPAAGSKEEAIHRFYVGEVDGNQEYKLFMEVYWTFENYEDFWGKWNKPDQKYDGILLSVQVVCQHEKTGQSSRVRSFYELSVTDERPEGEKNPAYEYQWKHFKWQWNKVWTEA